MPKIRSLKAEFFQDEDVSTSLVVKLLAAGLVCCLADDEGRFKAIPATIKALVFTHDRVSTSQIGEALVVLQRVGFLHLYEGNGKALGQIKNWARNQYIADKRRTPSTLPAYDESMADAIPTPITRHADDMQATGTTHLAREKGKEKLVP